VVCVCMCVVGMERYPHMLGKCSITESHPGPKFGLFGLKIESFI
jgi:hypothetical protein